MRLVLRIRCLGNRVLGRESVRRPLVWALQALVFGACGVLAFAIRFDLRMPPESRPFLLGALPVWILTKTGVFHAFRLEHGASGARNRQRWTQRQVAAPRKRGSTIRSA